MSSTRLVRLAAVIPVAALALVAWLAMPALPSWGAEDVRVIPAYTGKAAVPAGATETAVFAGGCFWGVQGVYQHVKGVKRALSGYAGGEKKTAHYEIVGTGRTGHAESVEIVFDPAQVTYAQLLQIYFSVAHDPTQLDRQGPDHGSQYRSQVFPTSEEQARIAKEYIAQLDAAKVFPARIVTKVEPAAFYRAEDYHQDFLELNPRYPYIVINDLPKVRALEKLFPTAYSKKPVLVSSST